jgi:hypothetical protein
MIRCCDPHWTLFHPILANIPIELKSNLSPRRNVLTRYLVPWTLISGAGTVVATPVLASRSSEWYIVPA